MLYNVFFSANGRTGICADFVAGLLANEAESYNWLWDEYRKPLKMTEADTLLMRLCKHTNAIMSRATMGRRIQRFTCFLAMQAVESGTWYENTTTADASRAGKRPMENCAMI